MSEEVVKRDVMKVEEVKKEEDDDGSMMNVVKISESRRKLRKMELFIANHVNEDLLEINNMIDILKMTSVREKSLI